MQTIPSSLALPLDEEQGETGEREVLQTNHNSLTGPANAEEKAETHSETLQTDSITCLTGATEDGDMQTFSTTSLTSPQINGSQATEEGEVPMDLDTTTCRADNTVSLSTFPQTDSTKKRKRGRRKFSTMVYADSLIEERKKYWRNCGFVKSLTNHCLFEPDPK